MGVLRHHHRHLYYYWLTTFTFLLFSSASPIPTLTSQPIGTVKHSEHMKEKQAAEGGGRGVGDEKRISGPGSWPPSCRSKCGWCSPCQPVHVPVQPGLIIRLEYYPEAWRCKCGNKLFMP